MHGEGQTAVISAFACNPMLCPRPVHKFLQRINYTSSYTIKTWPLFGWDAYFHIGVPTLIVRKRGKISLAWGAYFHSGVSIFTVKMGIRVPVFT